jgi:hypothetical protein
MLDAWIVDHRRALYATWVAAGASTILGFRPRSAFECFSLARCACPSSKVWWPFVLLLALTCSFADHDDRLSVDELRTLNEATMTDESERLKDEMLQVRNASGMPTCSRHRLPAASC